MRKRIAILIILLCDGEAMVIDGGPYGASSFVYSYIRNRLHPEHAEIAVATHPHEDHIGALSAVLNAIPVDVILSPVAEWDSSPFFYMKKYADEQGAPIAVPYEGDVYALGGATVTILHCWPEAWDVNDMSIVLRIDYGETSFLFTGDAEYTSEYMMIDAGAPLRADVLKVGHHGSDTSSTREFLECVSPRYAVISCKADNPYGHPHAPVPERLRAVGAEVLRTDLSGTLIVRSDGKRISIYPTGKAAQAEP